MKKTLTLAPGLELPAETAATETFAMLAMRGYGKTYAAKVICEELLDGPDPVAIIDPLGVYWGLRVGKDGKSPGYQNIVVMGGEHADVPLNVGMGEKVAEWCVREHRSVILDLSLLRKGQQVQFATDFAETLFHRNRRPRMVVVDEAHTFVPQKVMGDMARCVGAFEDIITKGRVKGLGCILTSQRASVVNWNVLSQVANLIALRTVAALDRDALKRWIVSNDPKDLGGKMLGELASLDRGDAWIWCPGGDGWPEVFGRYHFRELRTFDSSKTPKRGEKPADTPSMAPIDLEQLRGQFAEAVEEAEANDPKALRKKVAALEAQLLAARKEVVPQIVHVPQVVIVEKIPDDLLAEWMQFRVLYSRMVTSAREMHGELRDRYTAIEASIQRVQEQPAPEISAPIAPVPPPPAPKAEPKKPAAAPPPPAPQREVTPQLKPARGDDFVRLKPAAEKLLRIAAERHPWRLSRARLAKFAKVKPDTGSFRGYIPLLKSAGYIEEQDDVIEVLDHGFAYLGMPRPELPPTLDEMVAMWERVLEGGPARIMRICYYSPPGKLWSRDELADELGVKPDTGSFRGYIPLLKDLAIITETKAGIGFNWQMLER